MLQREEEVDDMPTKQSLNNDIDTRHMSKYTALGVVLVVAVLVTVCWTNCDPVFCQRLDSDAPSKEDDDSDIIVDAKELSCESKANLNKLLSEAIANAVNTRWKEYGITDKIELSFFSDLDALIKMKDSKTKIIVYLIKPGREVSKIRHVTFRENNRVVMEYTCLVARVTDAIAIANTVDIDKNDVSVQGVMLCHTANGKWKRVE